MENLWSQCKPKLVPDITDEQIEEMLEVMQPIEAVKIDGRRRFRLVDVKRVDPRSVAYTWSMKLMRMVRVYEGGLDSIRVPTFHSFGAPVFFKPSLAEVLGCIRHYCPDWGAIRFFWLNTDLGPEAIRYGHQCSFVTLFGEEKGENDVIDSTWLSDRFQVVKELGERAQGGAA